MNPSGIDEGKKRTLFAIGAGLLGLLILLAVLAEEGEEDEKNQLSHPAAAATFNNTLQTPGQGSLGTPIQADTGAIPVQNTSGQRGTETGRGKVWRQQYAEVRSARQAASQALRQISAHLGGRIKPFGSSAVADAEDRQFLMMFEGQERGQPIRGLLRVSVAEDGTYASAAWAPPGQDLVALLTQTARAEKTPSGGRTPPPAPVRWQNVPLPDGTGSIRLPEGWRITSVNTPQQGCISAEGPQGGIELGYATQVLTPEAAAMSLMPLPDTFPVAAYSNPERATADVFQIVARINQAKGLPAMRWGRVIHSEPAPATLGGQAAIVHFTWEKEQAGQWLPVESLAYVNMAPVSPQSWMYYNSFVSAPAAKFRQNLKTLLEIWGS
ncbi:MAG TPA: hypothetical protein PLQ00_11805, partial [Thermoguttaceae bacterium]|nr:hypothetical protein [Thermoguttaceae bacterium]